MRDNFVDKMCDNNQDNEGVSKTRGVVLRIFEGETSHKELEDFWANFERLSDSD